MSSQIGDHIPSHSAENAFSKACMQHSLTGLLACAGLPPNQRLKAAGLTALTRKRAEMKQKSDEMQVSINPECITAYIL